MHYVAYIRKATICEGLYRPPRSLRLWRPERADLRERLRIPSPPIETGGYAYAVHPPKADGLGFSILCPVVFPYDPSAAD